MCGMFFNASFAAGRNLAVTRCRPFVLLKTNSRENSCKQRNQQSGTGNLETLQSARQLKSTSELLLLQAD